MTFKDPLEPRSPGKSPSIEELPPLIIGGSPFNQQYTENPEDLPSTDILQLAFASGINAIDTSPYYGPSETIFGKALAQIKDAWPRHSYFICTKAGRVKADEFDYAPESIRKSVLRSCDRLGTDYLDLVYLHDIEFVTEDEIFGALKALKALKQEGVVRNIGVSGYPVEFLYKIALRAAQSDVGPLDAVLSYSNGCIQNTLLFSYYDKFLSDCGIKKIMNGSILSMSLLRSGSTHTFHPAPEDLQKAVKSVAQGLLENGTELAELSTRFAIKRWLFDTAVQPDGPHLQWNPKTSIVVGVSFLNELQVAIDSYRNVKLNNHGVNDDDEPLFRQVQAQLGRHLHETWPSGIPHDL